MKVILPESKLFFIKKNLLKEDKPLAERDNYTIGAEGDGGNNEYFHVDESTPVSENQEIEVDANEIKLDSFKKENELQPKIWKNFKLNSKVRLKLLDIADDFWDSLDLSWVKPKGVVLTGSICNYNWSKFSDIDLHIIVDFTDVSDKTEFVQEYFDSKKNEWNNEHDSLRIFGFTVELYVEDINASTESGGIYDVVKNEWLRKTDPNKIHPIGLDKYVIKSKAASIMTKIDDYTDESKSTDNDATLIRIGKKAHKLLKKIKAMRKYGLKRSGESDPYNIIYKVLRRTSYLDKLWDLSANLYDKINTIK